MSYFNRVVVFLWLYPWDLAHLYGGVTATSHLYTEQSISNYYIKQDWHPAFDDDGDAVVRKLVAVRGLAVYMAQGEKRR